jgi:hypothetical protein
MLCFGAGVGGVGAQGRAAAVSAGEATVLYQLHTELSERLVFRRSPFHARTGPARTAAWHFFLRMGFFPPPSNQCNNRLVFV